MTLSEALELPQINEVIAYMRATDPASWQTDVVRSKDGTRNCFFGHLHQMGGSDEEGTRLWYWFEEVYATTYMLYPVNDGEHPDYPQAEPKDRVIAYLIDLRDGRQPRTWDEEPQLCEVPSEA